MSRASPTITVDPLVLFSILDHAQRRQAGQERVIGTLLGTRSQDGTELAIKSSFAVPHNESAEQVEVDMEYHKNMYTLHLRANPREVLVGWYATTPDLNAFSALIQNFYSSQGDGTYPYPAIHMTMATDPQAGMKIQTYTSSPVGVTPERIGDSCLFVPIDHEIIYPENNRSGMDAIMAARNETNRSTTLPSDLDSLRSSIVDTLSMLERVQKYVDNARTDPSDTSKASAAVGRFLMDALSVRPSLDPEAIEKMFASHLQDVLMVAYLARTVREQLQLSSQMQILTA